MFLIFTIFDFCKFFLVNRKKRGLYSFFLNNPYFFGLIDHIVSILTSEKNAIKKLTFYEWGLFDFYFLKIFFPF